MNFLYPGFLFFLLAVAIPILIHLFNFRKFRKVYFSNVQFLKAVEEQHSSREKLRDLLILFSRILAIVFLVLAFARPYLSPGSAEAGATGRQVNIYIDNSYSMEAVSKEGSLLDEAKRKAKELAKHFTLNDRFQLTTNDFEGRHQRLVNYEELSRLIDEIRISPVQRSLQQVVNRQTVSKTAQRNTVSYVFSDFQRQFAGKIPVTASGSLSLIRLNANPLPNIAVDSVWSLSPAHQPGDQEKVVIQLKNYGDQPATGIPVKLVINNQQKALARVNVPAGKTIKDTLSFSGLSEGWQKAIVSIKDFPVTFDDELRFSFKVGRGLNILHISGDPSEKYINSLFSADRYFKLTSMSESNINYTGFSGYQVIVLSGLKTPSSGLAQQLKTYTQNGGTVVVFPDLDAPIPVYSSFLQALSVPAVTTVSKDTVNVNTIDLKSNLFNDVFDEVPAKLDLPKVNRYFIYTNSTDSRRENLMTLPASQSFFSRYRSGNGQIYLSATSLKKEDSNLPQHPVFVPLLYKIAFTSVREQPLYAVIGKDNVLPSAQLSLNPNETLRLVSGKQEVIPEIRQVPGKTLLYIADQVKTAAFYELKKADSLISIYAFNESRLESDMHYLADKELQILFGTQKIAVINSQTDLSAAAVENNRTDLWKLCLVLCVVFLAVEALLIQFFNKK